MRGTEIGIVMEVVAGDVGVMTGAREMIEAPGMIVDPGMTDVMIGGVHLLEMTETLGEEVDLIVREQKPSVA